VVTVADADNLTVQDRKIEFDAALKADGQKPRQPDEPIAVVVPRRQIETWILHLRGEHVDENQQCPHFRGHERSCAGEANNRPKMPRENERRRPSLAARRMR